MPPGTGNLIMEIPNWQAWCTAQICWTNRLVLCWVWGGMAQDFNTQLGAGAV